jgi:hypothetical protein
MGCVVNGPGEAREADLGIAAGRRRATCSSRARSSASSPRTRWCRPWSPRPSAGGRGVEARLAAADSAPRPRPRPTGRPCSSRRRAPRSQPDLDGRSRAEPDGHRRVRPRRALGEIAGSHLHPQGHALQLPVHTRRPNDVSVRASSSTRRPAAQVRRRWRRRRHRRRPRPSPAPPTTWTGARTRGEAQTVVVAVHHDQRAHQPGRGAPRRLPHVGLGARLVEIGDVEGAGEVLPSSWLVPICSALPSRIMASHVHVVVAPAKRSLSVLRPVRMGMASTFDHDVLVDVGQDLQREVAGLGFGGVRRVPSCHRNSVVRRNNRGAAPSGPRWPTG